MRLQKVCFHRQLKLNPSVADSLFTADFDKLCDVTEPFLIVTVRLQLAKNISPLFQQFRTSHSIPFVRRGHPVPVIGFQRRQQSVAMLSLHQVRCPRWRRMIRRLRHRECRHDPAGTHCNQSHGDASAGAAPPCVSSRPSIRNRPSRIVMGCGGQPGI